MQKIKKILFVFFCAPVIIFYGAIILFLYINGVSGADKWLAQFWQFTGHWLAICALVSGSIAWGYLISASTF